MLSISAAFSKSRVSMEVNQGDRGTRPPEFGVGDANANFVRFCCFRISRIRLLALDLQCRKT